MHQILDVQFRLKQAQCRNRSSFCLVLELKRTLASPPVEYSCQYPTKVERICNARVHTVSSD
jgi:hypothetical protein